MGIRTQLLDIQNSLVKNANDTIIGKTGNCYYVDPVNGSDTYSGLDVEHALATLTAALAKCTANQNDTVYLIANATGITLSANLDWNKAYTHLIGLCAPVYAGKRARVFQGALVTGMDLFTVSASGCIIKNMYFFHGVNDATSKVCCTVTGSRNYFENCHFAGIGNATMSVAGAASLKIDGGAENVFKNCQIGLDTIGRDADPNEIMFDSAATRNVFEDCQIYAYLAAGATGYSLVEVADAQGIDRYQIFKNCLFMTDSENRGVTMASAFALPAGIVQGKIVLLNCTLLTDGASGAGEWDSNNRGTIWTNNVAPAADAAGGIATKQ